MDPPTSDVPKLPDMVMCGDHPSFTKTELNVKEAKPEEKEKLKEKVPMSYARISPQSSRTERGERERGDRVDRVDRLDRVDRGDRVDRVASEHGLRALAARRRVRSLEAVQRPELDAAPPNRALVQAALGSFRWPPYLLCVWVAVLVLTHALHCLVGLLERTLPNFKKLCQYFRNWTTESWRAETELNHRIWPVGLAAVTGALYALYGALLALHAAALWAIEPLCPDDEKTPANEIGVKITNYVEEVASRTNSSIKH